MSQNVETSFGGDAYLQLRNRLRQTFRKSRPVDWERLEEQVSVAPAAVEPDALVAEPIPVYAAAIGSGFARQPAAERDKVAIAIGPGFAEQLGAERDAAAIGPGFAEQVAAEWDEAAAVVVAVEQAWPVSSGSHFAPVEAQARALADESRFHYHRCCGSRRDRSARRDCSNAPWASKSAAALFFERALPELVEAELGRGEELDS